MKTLLTKNELIYGDPFRPSAFREARELSKYVLAKQAGISREMVIV
jgi:hypothetical protein